MASAGVPEVIVSARGLGKSFGGHAALEDLDLTISRGRALGYLGPNGSGKTTTVRLLTGLLHPTAGHVDLFGERLTRSNAGPMRARLGVQSDANLYEGLTVEENLRVWGDLFAMSRARRRARITEVLDVLGLDDRRGARLGSLSKGTRQKVAIARAILHEPELLFLDEPTAGLDPAATDGLIAYLAALKQRGDTTIVICTHQLHGLEVLCDDLAVVQHGRLVTAGAVDELVGHMWPGHEVRIRTGIRTDAALGALAALPEVSAWVDGGELLVSTGADRVPAAIAALVRAGVDVHSVVPVQHSIHDLYFGLLSRNAR